MTSLTASFSTPSADGMRIVAYAGNAQPSGGNNFANNNASIRRALA